MPFVWLYLGFDYGFDKLDIKGDQTRALFMQYKDNFNNIYFLIITYILILFTYFIKNEFIVGIIGSVNTQFVVQRERLS